MISVCCPLSAGTVFRLPGKRRSAQWRSVSSAQRHWRPSRPGAALGAVNPASLPRTPL